MSVDWGSVHGEGDTMFKARNTSAGCRLSNLKVVSNQHQLQQKVTRTPSYSKPIQRKQIGKIILLQYIHVWSSCSRSYPVHVLDVFHARHDNAFWAAVHASPTQSPSDLSDIVVLGLNQP